MGLPFLLLAYILKDTKVLTDNDYNNSFKNQQ